MPGVRTAWCLILATALSGCTQQAPTIVPLADTIEIHATTDDESRKVASLLRDALVGELRAANASEQVIVAVPAELKEVHHLLKRSRSEVVVTVGLQPKYRGEVSNAISVAVRHLDQQGTQIFTVLADLPDTRRRAYFGFDPETEQRDAEELASLAARQIVAYHVHKRQISTFQLLRSSGSKGSAAKP